MGPPCCYLWTWNLRSLYWDSLAGEYSRKLYLRVTPEVAHHEAVDLAGLNDSFATFMVESEICVG
jgi:hypothetical protein